MDAVTEAEQLLQQFESLRSLYLSPQPPTHRTQIQLQQPVDSQARLHAESRNPLDQSGTDSANYTWISPAHASHRDELPTEQTHGTQPAEGKTTSHGYVDQAGTPHPVTQQGLDDRAVGDDEEEDTHEAAHEHLYHAAPMVSSQPGIGQWSDQLQQRGKTHGGAETAPKEQTDTVQPISADTATSPQTTPQQLSPVSQRSTFTSQLQAAAKLDPTTTHASATHTSSPEANTRQQWGTAQPSAPSRPTPTLSTSADGRARRRERAQGTSHGVNQFEHTLQPAVAATRIQAVWRGYVCRRRDGRCVAIRHEIRHRRAEAHIRHLHTRLTAVSHQLAHEQELRVLQRETLAAVWHQVRAWRLAQEEEVRQKRLRAAITLQKHLRGWLARKKFGCYTRSTNFNAVHVQETRTLKIQVQRLQQAVELLMEMQLKTPPGAASE
eukprot:m.89466 g.89466  ORF g.89466 m.89466 type:complete len:437 (+) comp12894_c0_seq4:253-1563(+)